MAEALRCTQVRIESLYVEESAARSTEVLDAEDAGLQVRLVRDGALTQVLDLGTAPPVVALAQQRTASAVSILEDAMRLMRPVVVLVELADPGNVGTIIRQSEAFGAVGVLSVGAGVDVFNPKVVRAAAGALFRVPVSLVEETEEAMERLGAAGVPSLATVGIGGAAPEDLDLQGSVAVLVGNEAHGLPPEVLQVADIRCSIPMEGAVESLNAASSAAVVLYEASRQRRHTVGHDGRRRATTRPDVIPNDDGSSRT